MAWICIVSILNCKYVNGNFHVYFMIYIGIMQCLVVVYMGPLYIIFLSKT